MDVEFYFDISCPQAYLAYTQLETLEQQGARILLKPVSLVGLYRIWTQHEEAPQARYSTSRRRMEHRDLMRQAEVLQVFVNEAATLDPPNGTDAMRLIVGAPEDRRLTLIRNLFQVLWVDGEDVDNRGVLEWIAEVSGVDPALMDRPEVRMQLDAATEAAANAGIFGVPSFRLAGRLWWGLDRIAFVERALGGIAEAPPVTHRPGGQIEFFHDFASPFSYLAATQIEDFAAHHGATLIWRPILLGGLFKRIHAPLVPLSVMSRPRREYMARDLMDWAETWGVPFQFNSAFPLNTLLALRVALAAPQLTLPLYRAAWVENRDIGQPEVIAQVIREAGRVPEEIFSIATRDEIKDRLRANTETAEAMGACGVPTFRVNDRLVIWGQDRFDMVHRALEGWMPAIDVQART
jgi:2-hydroxychromene-2-carboxylate isomerase